MCLRVSEILMLFTVTVANNQILFSNLPYSCKSRYKNVTAIEICRYYTIYCGLCELSSLLFLISLYQLSCIIPYDLCLHRIWVINFKKAKSWLLSDVIIFANPCIHKSYCIFAKYMPRSLFQMNIHGVIVRVSHVTRRPRSYNCQTHRHTFYKCLNCVVLVTMKIFR